MKAADLRGLLREKCAVVDVAAGAKKAAVDKIKELGDADTHAARLERDVAIKEYERAFSAERDALFGLYALVNAAVNP